MDQSLLAKIQKLLRLSESQNENEASLALEKAKALCVEHDIDIAMARVDNKQAQEKEEFVKDCLAQGKRRSVTQMEVSILLIAHFNVELVYSGNRDFGMKMYFVGRKSDVELATYVNSFLNAEFMKRWHAYRERNYWVTTDERASFLRGMRVGLCDKLDKAKRDAENNKFALMANADAVRNQYALTIVDEKKARLDAKNNLFSGLKPVKTKEVAANEEGYREGQKIEIRAGLGGGNQRQLSEPRLALK
jgi:hypothetical protein